MAERLNLTHLTVRLIELPTRASLAAAHDPNPEAVRRLTIVAAHADGDFGSAAGWGECSALNTVGYTSESAQTAFEAFTSGDTVAIETAPMAFAALAHARLDAELRADGQSLAERLGTAGQSAPAGAAVGLAPIPTMLDEVEALAAAGFGRIKAKIAPGRVVEPVRAIRDRFPDIELQVDANGSLGPNDLGLLASLRDLGVRAVEQPFAVDDHGLGGRLVADTDLTVLADEGVRNLDQFWGLARAQAATAVTVKPPCLGGIAATLELLDAMAVAGFAGSLGGMLESGLGRNLLAALAPLSAFTITGDLSPAGRWLAADPFPDVEMVDGRIAAPSGPGICGDPDIELLDHHTVATKTVELPPAAE